MKREFVFSIVICGLAVALFIAPLFPWYPRQTSWWWLSSIVLGTALVAAALVYFSRERSTKELALIAALGAVSAVLRVPFAPLPGIQPSTFLIICTGFVFGPVAGFLVGSITPFISNFFLGHGPWTVYQMLTWGMIGVLSSLVGRFKMQRVVLVIFGVLCGYIFGWMMNLWFVTITIPSFAGLVAASIASLWPDTVHAIANGVFLLLFGTRTIALLERFRERFLVYYRHSSLPTEGV